MKVDTGILIIVLVTVLMLGSWSYSYVSAFSLLSAIDHHKSFDKKQDSSSIGAGGSSISKHATNDDADGGKDNGGSPESSSYDKVLGRLHKTLGRLYDSFNTGDSSSITSSGSGSGAKNSHNPNNQDNGVVDNNHRGTNDVSNTNPENSLPTTEPTGSSNFSDSTSTDTTTTKDDTPFVLSLPFP